MTKQEISHEVFALVVIVIGAVLLFFGKLASSDWVTIVQWLGVAIVGGKAVQTVGDTIVVRQHAATQAAQPPTTTL